MTTAELKAKAAIVKNETAEHQNTANRTGELFENVIDFANEINESLAVLDVLEAYDLLIDDKYITTNGTLVSNVVYRVHVFNTSKGLYKLSGSLTGTSVKIWALYTDINCTTLHSVGTTYSASPFEELINIPTNGLYLAITKYDALSFTLYSNSNIVTNITALKSEMSTVNTDLYGTVNTNGIKNDVTKLNQLKSDLLLLDKIKTQDSTIADKLINTAGVIATNSAYSVHVFSATEYQYRYVGDLGGSGLKIWALYNDLACTSLHSAGTTYSGSAFDITINIPVIGLYLAVTKYDFTTTTLYSDSGVVNNINTLDSRVDLIETNTLVFDSIEPYTSRIVDKYLTSSGSLASNTAYNIDVYSATKKNYQIAGSSGGSILLWAFFNDELCTSLYSKGTNYSSSPFSYTILPPTTGLYLAVTKYDFTTTNVLVDSGAATNILALKAKVYGAKTILAIGDSLTAAGIYITKLNTLLSVNGTYTIVNGGVGGEGTQSIMSRQGGAFAYLTSDILLPSGTTAVQIGNYSNSGIANSWDNSNISLLRQGGNGVNPVEVDGVPCTLSWTGSNYNDPAGTYTLTRLVAGTARTLYSGSPIITNLQKYRDLSATIFYMGTNGGWSSVQDFVDCYKAMIRASNTNNFLIIGLHYYSGWSLGSQFAALETAMGKEFGSKYLNYRKYLIGNALSDAGITPTTPDNTAISNGVCPPSLLSDTIHFNTTGYNLLGEQIYKRGVKLGYWI